MDFSSLAFTGSTVAAVMALVAIGLALFVFLSKRRISNNAEAMQAEGSGSIKNRTKYPMANVFANRGTYLNMGAVLSLLLILFAFNWTEYDEQVHIPEGALELPDDLEIEPPRTAEPPPPPPPPPPPVIEEVPEEEIEEEEEPEFVDQSIEEEEEVVQEKPEPAPPPPPPPPPPPKVEEIFKVVEDMPTFPGCEDVSNKAERKQCADKKMLEFIYKNIKYPAIARENGVEGMVVIQFVVEKDGSISQPKIARDIGAQCGDEAMRIVKQMPKWNPGKQRGRAVKVQFNLPVRFKLE